MDKIIVGRKYAQVADMHEINPVQNIKSLAPWEPTWPYEEWTV